VEKWSLSGIVEICCLMLQSHTFVSMTAHRLLAACRLRGKRGNGDTTPGWQAAAGKGACDTIIDVLIEKLPAAHTLQTEVLLTVEVWLLQ
jgi:hypothetical protein